MRTTFPLPTSPILSTVSKSTLSSQRRNTTAAVVRQRPTSTPAASDGCARLLLCVGGRVKGGFFPRHAAPLWPGRNGW